jgi:LmbE family N-acetylglucosaminyl deacetylase
MIGGATRRPDPRARMASVATVLAFHAHPDDEAVLTGGTLARLAAEGHRVIIAVACDGVMGPATGQNGRARLDMLRASAAALGATGVEHLGYADSGHGPVLYPDPPDRARFVRADLDEAAGRLAELIRRERVDVLLSYDERGGNGHPDHVKVHEVGMRAAELTGTRLLAATIPRELVAWAFYPLRVTRLLVRYDPQVIRGSFAPRKAITHRIDVRRYARQKRAALAAHHAEWQRTGRAARLARFMLALPVPLFALFLGREWFIEPGVAPAAQQRDILQPAA